MRECFRSTWIRIGLVLLILGSGPFEFINIAAELGWWPDPNPNPVGPGLLMVLTFWPAMVCIAVGVFRLLWHRLRAD